MFFSSNKYSPNLNSLNIHHHLLLVLSLLPVSCFLYLLPCLLLLLYFLSCSLPLCLLPGLLLFWLAGLLNCPQELCHPLLVLVHGVGVIIWV